LTGTRLPERLAAGYPSLAIAEAADQAICASMPFCLLHAVAIAKLVGQVASFGDDAVAASAGRLQPSFGLGEAGDEIASSEYRDLTETR
jgi:hypothetical protein